MMITRTCYTMHYFAKIYFKKSQLNIEILTDLLTDAHVLIRHKLLDGQSPLLGQLADATLGTHHLQPRAAEVRLGPEHGLLFK